MATLRGGWRSDGHAQKCTFGQQHADTATIRGRMGADRIPIGPGKILSTSYSILFSTFLTSNLERNSSCAACLSWPKRDRSTVKSLPQEMREHPMAEPAHQHNEASATGHTVSRQRKGREAHGEKHEGTPEFTATLRMRQKLANRLRPSATSCWIGRCSPFWPSC